MKKIFSIILSVLLLTTFIGVSAASEKKIIINYVHVSSLDISEDEFVVTFDVRNYDEIYDAKKNVHAVVYDFADNSLLIGESYKIEYEDVNTLRAFVKVNKENFAKASDRFMVKFTYNGSYGFSGGSGNLGSVATYTRVKSVSVVDAYTMTSDLKIVNGDDNSIYYATCNGNVYNLRPLGNGIYRLSMPDVARQALEEEEQYISYTVYKQLGETKNPDTDQAIGYKNFSFYDMNGNAKHDGHRGESFAVPEYIGAGETEFYVEIFPADTYDQADYFYESEDNINLKLYNTANGNVMELSHTLSLSNGAYKGVVTVPSSLSEGKYLFVADDGMRIRNTTIEVLDEPYIENAYLSNKDEYIPGLDNEYIYAKTDEDIYGGFSGFTGIKDTNLLSIEACEPNGNVLFTADKDTMVLKKTVDGRPYYSFKMKTFSGYCPYTYLLRILYDGKLLKETKITNYKNSGSNFYDFYVYRACRAKNKVTVMAYCSGNADVDDFTFTFYGNDRKERAAESMKKVVRYNSEFYLFTYTVEDAENYTPSEMTYTKKDNPSENGSTYINYYEASTIDYAVIDYSHSVGTEYMYFYGANLPKTGAKLYCYDVNMEKEYEIEAYGTDEGDCLYVETEDFPKTALYSNVTFDIDGEYIKSYNLANYDTDRESGECFYAFNYSQSHGLSLLMLPYKKYSQYKIALTPEALAGESYKECTKTAVFNVPSKTGVQYIYGQFKDAKGNETPVMSAIVRYDDTPVDIEFDNIFANGVLFNNETNTLLKKANINMPVKGKAEINLYTDKGVLCASGSMKLEKGENKCYLYVNPEFYDDLPVSETEKVELIFYDEHNKTLNTYMFDNVNIKEPVIRYEQGNSYLLFNKITGIITEGYIDTAEFSIPEKIEGYIVRGIESWAISGQNVRTVTIPPTITEVEWSSFGDTEIKTVKGVKGSRAEEYAQENGYTFVEISGEPYKDTIILADYHVENEYVGFTPEFLGDVPDSITAVALLVGEDGKLVNVGTGQAGEDNIGLYGEGVYVKVVCFDKATMKPYAKPILVPLTFD